MMISETETIVYITIGAALFFDFVNGFHDSANSIATVVRTKVLKPIQAVGMAAIANVARPFLFGTSVAETVGKDILQPEFSTVIVILAGLVGAITWNLITWYFGLPSSNSHALIGGLTGAGLIAGGPKALVPIGIEKVVAFMVLSSVLDKEQFEKIKAEYDKISEEHGAQVKGLYYISRDEPFPNLYENADFQVDIIKASIRDGELKTKQILNGYYRNQRDIL
ncbi:MAG: inorganic phosphate transporter [Nitrososphaeraceae archaeon]